MVPKGEHIHDHRVNYYRTAELNLDFVCEVPFHVDGELHFAREFQVQVIPAALTIIYNPAGNHIFVRTADRTDARIRPLLHNEMVRGTFSTGAYQLRVNHNFPWLPNI